MKLNDIVRVTTGDHAGQTGRVICLFQGYVTLLRDDMVAVQERVERCEVIHV